MVYDVVKETILGSGYLKDGIPCHFLAAATAGFTATLVASPVDVVKTRYFLQKVCETYLICYCRKIIKSECPK